jgi:hypothetical protein
MKTKRLIQLQVSTVIMLAAYVLLSAYLFFAIPSGQPMWSSMGLAQREIQSADLPRLQSDLHSAVSSLATFRHDKNILLLVCLAATVGVVCFLGWSVFVINRIKREVDHVA